MNGLQICHDCEYSRHVVIRDHIGRLDAPEEWVCPSDSGHPSDPTCPLHDYWLELDEEEVV